MNPPRLPGPVSWVRFEAGDGRTGFGVLDAERVVEYTGEFFGAATPAGRILEKGQFALLSPCQPSKVIAVWNNFHALAAKIGKPGAIHPLYLIKPASSVVGPGAPIRRPKNYTGKIVFEGELAVVIGRRASGVSSAQALDHIFGYTCINDVTAVELIAENPDFAQWTRAKGYDSFGCLGPAIARGLNWRDARVVTRLDGVERQNYPLSDMVVTPGELVSRISQDMTLVPGDVIACGTSIGAGSIKDGATIEVFIDAIGSLVNSLQPAIQ